MVAADGSLIATFFSENRSATSLNRMGEWAPKAIVAVEDERFFEHGGVDTRGTLRALGNNVLGGSQQGASTLTQQYVKQVQLESAVYSGDPESWPRCRPRSPRAGRSGYGRKLREAKLAISLEEQLTKDDILERYLNIANFGNATYGIQAAAQRYFSVNAEQLTLPQAAAAGRHRPGADPLGPARQPRGARSAAATSCCPGCSAPARSRSSSTTRPSPRSWRSRRRETQRGCITAGQLAYFCDYVAVSSSSATPPTARPRSSARTCCCAAGSASRPPSTASSRPAPGRPSAARSPRPTAPGRR